MAEVGKVCRNRCASSTMEQFCCNVNISIWIFFFVGRIFLLHYCNSLQKPAAASEWLLQLIRPLFNQGNYLGWSHPVGMKNEILYEQSLNYWKIPQSCLPSFLEWSGGKLYVFKSNHSVHWTHFRIAVIKINKNKN